jgi:FkbM family methyltransferase
VKETVLKVGQHLPSRIRRLMAYAGLRMMSEEDRDQFLLHLQAASMEWSLRNMRRLGFKPDRIIDVGAFVGEWTQMVRRIFIEAQIHMLEARPSEEPRLKALAESDPCRITYEIALVGPNERDVTAFFEHDSKSLSGSGVLQEQSSAVRATKTYPMRTLDNILAAKQWNRVGLLKLDVQGYELEVLKGAEHILSKTEAVLMEVSLIPINVGAPLLHEVIAFMHQRGFRAYDICSLTRRPLDRALWQSDLIFIQEKSPLLAIGTFD